MMTLWNDRVKAEKLHEYNDISQSRTLVAQRPSVTHVPRACLYSALDRTCQQWRRQLWGTGARAPSPLDFQQFHF